MQERRKFIRLDTRVRVEYDIIESRGDRTGSFTKNLSQGGICLFLDSLIQKDTLLKLKLFLPEQSEPIETTGKIVWIDMFKVGGKDAQEEYEAGIEFRDIAKEDQEKISKYVFGVLNLNNKGK
ncbi:MAG: PilZ domain-containing protein [Candidatus Omnitrophica bacterium]|nr:PilZ domain-containing protein [Candidatus Omnitrophota bacterium]